MRQHPHVQVRRSRGHREEVLVNGTVLGAVQPRKGLYESHVTLGNRDGTVVIEIHPSRDVALAHVLKKRVPDTVSKARMMR